MPRIARGGPLYIEGWVRLVHWGGGVGESEGQKWCWDRILVMQAPLLVSEIHISFLKEKLISKFKNKVLARYGCWIINMWLVIVGSQWTWGVCWCPATQRGRCQCPWPAGEGSYLPGGYLWTGVHPGQSASCKSVPIGCWQVIVSAHSRNLGTFHYHLRILLSNYNTSQSR